MRNLKYTSPEIGEKSRALIERDKKIMFGAHTKSRELPLTVESACGSRIKDLDGREFLDFGAGYAVVGAGHCPGEITKAIAEQAGKLIHISGSDFYYYPQVLLAEKIASLIPGDFAKKVYFSNSGAESLEAAFKLTRHYTRRPKVIAFLGAFHGRTYVGMTLSGSKKIQKAHYSPLIPEVTHTPYPYCFRCLFNRTYPECRGKNVFGETAHDFAGIPMLPCVSFLVNVVFEQLVDPEDVAAIFVEPIQGEGGYVVPPPEFHPLLYGICKKHGVLLVLDEIQAGLGRTGKMFAIEHWGVEPDVICVAKAIASGLPLGATIGRAELMDAEVDARAWRAGSHGSTFGGGPVCCAAGLATLSLLENGLVDNARDVGAYMKEKLSEMMNRYRVIGDVRGLGLMIGVEIVQDKKTKQRFPDQVTAEGKNIKEVIVGNCFKLGLIAYGAGVSAIRFSPPLIVSRSEVDEALGIFERVINEIEGQM